MLHRAIEKLNICSLDQIHSHTLTVATKQSMLSTVPAYAYVKKVVTDLRWQVKQTQDAQVLLHYVRLSPEPFIPEDPEGTYLEHDHSEHVKIPL